MVDKKSTKPENGCGMMQILEWGCAMAERWGYTDAIAYALALSNPDRQSSFTADPARWHTAIYELRSKYADKFPEAFRYVMFETKPGQPPYSAQVEHFLHVLAQSRLLSEPNPAYAVLDMGKDQKKTVRQLNESRLSHKADLLREIGEELSVKVRVR